MNPGRVVLAIVPMQVLGCVLITVYLGAHGWPQFGIYVVNIVLWAALMVIGHYAAALLAAVRAIGAPAEERVR